MKFNNEWKPLTAIVVVFLAFFFIPVGTPRFDNAVFEALLLARWYAQEHVLLCLIPAFFIAGAIGVFVRQESVMKYLGAKAEKVVAYSVASVSGTILAVCSCTVLPLFAGIYRMGAGLGPATAFLYSGPAINVLAIIMTARILGAEIGIARAIGAVLFSVVIGLLMHLFFHKEEQAKLEAQTSLAEPEVPRPLWQTAVFFASMIGILVFANWGKPANEQGFWATVHFLKWPITAAFAILMGGTLVRFYRVPLWKLGMVGVVTGILALAFHGVPLVAFGAGVIGLSWVLAREEGESSYWLETTWEYAKQIMPLLLIGVLVAGFLLGRPGNEGVIPNVWIERALGGNSIWANLFASVAGAFMYFATLTEVPIVQGLIGSGMGKGPALALLLAGPALSLPSMLVIGSIMGAKKTVVFVSLVVVMATLTGWMFGTFF